MTDAEHRNADADNASGLDIEFDPGTTDLGDDVNRDAANRGSTLSDDASEEGGLDPGNTDLGYDVYRSADEG